MTGFPNNNKSKKFLLTRRKKKIVTLIRPLPLLPLLLLLFSQQIIPTVECKNNYKSYRLWSSDEIHSILEEWTVEYPDLVRLTTAQEAYGLPSAGSAYDCPFYYKNGCPNAILTIQDFITHPIGSKSSNALPEVLWSGCVHGNERVGPTVVMETAWLLLEAATCESILQQYDNDDACRHTLAESGIDDVQRRWLARLVTTRRIVIVPTANALGYYRNHRTEDGIDPNRDFPYDLLDPTMCMRTIAGRTLNELFLSHQFQMALTFHGGIEVVAYEWGNPSWYGSLSPDDLAQYQIAAAYSHYGGTWDGTTPYEYGTMNDMVYYVRGGMEDWAYAGSWDTERVIGCQPTTYGGYPVEKTTSQYKDSTLRAFNMLIETSNDKNPLSQLGTSEDLLNANSKGSGHVSRNIRLSLLSADLVEPYVSIVQVNDILLSQDIVPLLLSSSSPSPDCGARIVVDGNNSTTTITNNSNNNNNKTKQELKIYFTVGGALTIDQVQLWYANKKDIFLSTSNDDCFAQPTIAGVSSFFTKASIVGSTSGTGRFHSNHGPTPKSTGEDGNIISAGPLFVGIIDIPSTSAASNNDEWVILASARVDQDWSIVPDENDVGGPKNHIQRPQSHMANVRTNLNWKHDMEDGRKIRGRLDWFSQPLTVVVVSNNDNDQNKEPTIVPSDAPTTTTTTRASSSAPSSSPVVISSSAPSTDHDSNQSLVPTTAADSSSGELSNHPSSGSSQNSMLPSDFPSQVPTTFQGGGGGDNNRSSDPTGNIILDDIPTVNVVSPPSSSTSLDNPSTSSPPVEDSSAASFFFLWKSPSIIFFLVVTTALTI